MTMSVTERFTEFLSDLEDCDDNEQKQKIHIMNEVIDKMNRKEFISVFTKMIFNQMNKIVEENKMSIDNTILLLKQIGYCNMMKSFWNYGFEHSSLNERFEKMIIDENEKKKDEKNEKLLVNLCECYVMLRFNFIPEELLSICVSCILKVALNKEENEKAQKEVEMALLALSNMGYCSLRQNLFLHEIKEIILHHQEHRNLTRLAYQSVWDFLIDRFF
ncbi:uncharacterized protein MONOS_15929 [Monocercomonoides exilis]|uniref:uncharacterized protein n=1 Tax=Monocercomonoides exilis TaxID=2049356 RepID=UPI003559D00B|nr:hypothetical protein MONOS_15929 [Monocercomonoides exilis]